MDWTFAVTPQPYGAAHISILLGIAALSVGFWFAIRVLSDRACFRLLFWMGVGMLLAEAWKQWFVVRYVYETRSMWFFPWQLCSMAMYGSALVPFLKGRLQNAVLVFLCSFSVIGAVFALLFPQDMMRDQILLFSHSFLYHAVMLLEALVSLRILQRRSKAPFLPALGLFCILAAVAEGINVVSHLIIRDIRYESNMFYITPFYPSTQPVFSLIAQHAGVAVEIVVYLGVIALAAFGLYRLEQRVILRSVRS